MNHKIEKNRNKSQKSLLIFNLSTTLNIKELLDLFKSYGNVV